LADISQSAEQSAYRAHHQVRASQDPFSQQPSEVPVIELVIVYCLSSDTKTCTEKRLPMEDFSTAMGCTMSAQQRAQQYLKEHPAYRLKSWRCEVNVPHEEHI
jgi:hypothetical protein